VRIVRSTHEEGWDIRAANLWAGPLPAAGVWSVCTPVAYDDAGNELWRGWSFANRARGNEYFRSNGIFGIGSIELHEEPARADMPCELWTRETWTSSQPPTIRRDRKSKTVTVEAPLTWEHEPVVALDSHCRVELLREDEGPVEAKVVRGPSSPWGGRADSLVLRAQFRVRHPRAVSSATVTCVPRGQPL
jgi:hypothetical protein